MSDMFDSDSSESGGSKLSDGEGDEAPWSPHKPNRPMKHLMPRWRTQRNIQNWLAMTICL